VKYHAEAGYGDSIMKAVVNCRLDRAKLDQGWPDPGAPDSGAVTTTNNWAAATPYAQKAIVKVAGGTYYLYCTVAGTSSSVEPTPANYSVNIVDNSVTWQLLAPVNYASLRCDGGACTSIDSDHTGPFEYGVYLTNSSQNCRFVDITVGQCLSVGIYCTDVFGIILTDSQITSGMRPDSTGIAYGNGFVGETDIKGNQIFSWGHGIAFDTGGANRLGATMSGNQIFGCSINGIDIEADQTDFIIQGNNCSDSPVWGANTIAIQVKGGTSDRYTIANNLVSGGGVSDGGTGVNKNVADNF
jgi:hypothetical protein